MWKFRCINESIAKNQYAKLRAFNVTKRIGTMQDNQIKDIQLRSDNLQRRNENTIVNMRQISKIISNA
jgi:hypothetical protein